MGADLAPPADPGAIADALDERIPALPFAPQAGDGRKSGKRDPSVHPG
jgi:hypothetical protein